MTSNKARINIEEQGGLGQAEPATLEKEKKKIIQGPHSLPWQELEDKDHRKILYGHIPLHDLAPSASLHAGLYYLSALTPPTLKSGSSALTSNHQTPYYTAPLPPPHPTRRGPFPLGLYMPHPDTLSFSTANCYANKVAWIDPWELAQKHMQSV